MSRAPDPMIKDACLGEQAAQDLLGRYMAELEVRYPEDGAGVPSAAADFLPPAGAFLVAWVRGVPAGCGGLRRYSETICEVKRLYVEPWGRGAGLARLLLAALEAAAARAGYGAVRLETGTRQPEALGLYRSTGYQLIEPYGEFKLSPLSVCFEKSLVAGAAQNSVR